MSLPKGFIFVAFFLTSLSATNAAPYGFLSNLLNSGGNLLDQTIFKPISQLGQAGSAIGQMFQDVTAIPRDVFGMLFNGARDVVGAGTQFVSDTVSAAPAYVNQVGQRLFGQQGATANPQLQAQVTTQYTSEPGMVYPNQGGFGQGNIGSGQFQGQPGVTFQQPQNQNQRLPAQGSFPTQGAQGGAFGFVQNGQPQYNGQQQQPLQQPLQQPQQQPLLQPLQQAVQQPLQALQQTLQQPLLQPQQQQPQQFDAFGRPISYATPTQGQGVQTQNGAYGTSPYGNVAASQQPIGNAPQVPNGQVYPNVQGNVGLPVGNNGIYGSSPTGVTGNGQSVQPINPALTSTGQVAADNSGTTQGRN